MITQEQYHSLKEYYDWQRVIEYNREQTYLKAEQIVEGMKEQGADLDLEMVFEELWNDINHETYQYPVPVDWTPKNKDLRIQGIDNL